MLPLSCTCSLAREDVLYPNFGGAKAPMVVQKRLNVSTKVLAADTSTGHCCTVCGAYLFSTTPCVHRPPTFSCLLASNNLTWAAFSLPLSCFGFAIRNDVSRLCSRGAMAPRCFTIKPLCAAMASHTPWSARTHHPPFAPVSPRLLLCGSLSTLSLSLSPALSPALSFALLLSVPFPLCPTLSLSLLSVPLPLRSTLSLALSLPLSLSLSLSLSLFLSLSLA